MVTKVEIKAAAQAASKKTKRKLSFMTAIANLFEELTDEDGALPEFAIDTGRHPVQEEAPAVTNIFGNTGLKVITEQEYMAELYETLASKIGLQEIVGYRHNPAIVGMFEACGHSWVKDDETPWCAAFIGWGIKVTSERLGLAVEGTRKLNARSYLDWGQEIALHEITRGDIVIIPRNNSNWQGHVFVFSYWDGERMVGLGGNQHNAVNTRRYDPDSTRILGIRRVVLN